MPRVENKKPDAGREGRLIAIFRAGVLCRLGDPELLRGKPWLLLATHSPP
jgi:hypothetical protein